MAQTKTVADVLMQKGLLTPDVLKKAQDNASSQGMALEDALLSVGVDPVAVGRAAGEIYALPFIDLAGRKITFDVLNKFPEDVARKYAMVVIEAPNDQVLKVALAKPWDVVTRKALDFIRDKNHLTIDPYITTESGVTEVLTQYQNPVLQMKDEAAPSAQIKPVDGVTQAPAAPAATPAQSASTAVASDNNELAALVPEEITDSTQLQQIVAQSAVPRMVAAIIKYAVAAKASDIHIEPNEEADTRVRFRIDGVLVQVCTVPAKDHPALASRIKILARLKIDETRVPQDGRIDVLFGDREIDLRLSTFPTINGEKIVMRILDKGGGVIEMERLGLANKALEYLIEAIKIPHGILLVTGPTGSGKSTTLYAIIGRLNKEGVNIVTLEDPVEYQINGIAQSQVKPFIGYTFAQGLRSILRQDPNIIMVGEIRDKETAEMAVQAALTGHLVLSTLHTNDSAGAIPRLIDMGVEPFLISSSLHTVIAQRLVRKVCQSCKEVDALPEKVMSDMKSEYDKIPDQYKKDIPFEVGNVMKGKGCSVCGGKGYKGRLGIYELLPVSPGIQELTNKRASGADIFTQAVAEGMITMKQDGILKVLQGITTMEEVYRVTTV